MNCSNRYCVILKKKTRPRTIAISLKEFRLTKTPILQGLSRTLLHITSLITSLFPAVRAMSSKFLLLSRPIVHMSPGRSRGRGRYLPFPVPESSPTHPVQRLSRNLAIMGQGYLTDLRSIRRMKDLSHLVSCRSKVRGNLIVDGMDI